MITRFLEPLGLCNIETKNQVKADKQIRICYNLLFLLNIITDMFEFENLPDTINPTILALLTITNGHCGVAKDGEDYYACIGSWGGEISKVNGIGDKYISVFLDGSRVNGEVAILKNNNTMTRDIMELYDVALNMTETDISIRCNVLFTRLLPIFKCSDEKQRKAIEEVLEKATDGKINTFLADLKEIDLDGSFKSVEKFDLTQPQEVDKIQYLTKYYDDIMRRFYTKYGHSMAGTQKMAQQNNSEISMNDTISMIYPTEKLKCYKEFCKELKDKFGLDVEVRFSECWRVRAEKTEEDTRESDTEVLENNNVSRETLETESVDNE
ncbi:MAG: hypothetical protein U0L88_13150 [Acutalibacteraceae bacterium]|nr:hypothetical protein [Acutalibacteraceae bacterium]